MDASSSWFCSKWKRTIAWYSFVIISFLMESPRGSSPKILFPLTTHFQKVFFARREFAKYDKERTFNSHQKPIRLSSGPKEFKSISRRMHWKQKLIFGEINSKKVKCGNQKILISFRLRIFDWQRRTKEKFFAHFWSTYNYFIYPSNCRLFTIRTRERNHNRQVCSFFRLHY